MLAYSVFLASLKVYYYNEDIIKYVSTNSNRNNFHLTDFMLYQPHYSCGGASFKVVLGQRQAIRRHSLAIIISLGTVFSHNKKGLQDSMFVSNNVFDTSKACIGQQHGSSIIIIHWFTQQTKSNVSYCIEDCTSKHREIYYCCWASLDSPPQQCRSSKAVPSSKPVSLPPAGN